MFHFEKMEHAVAFVTMQVQVNFEFWKIKIKWCFPECHVHTYVYACSSATTWTDPCSLKKINQSKIMLIEKKGWGNLFCTPTWITSKDIMTPTNKLQTSGNQNRLSLVTFDPKYFKRCLIIARMENKTKLVFSLYLLYLCEQCLSCMHEVEHFQ